MLSQSFYVIKPDYNVKYIQGLHYNNGDLFYGTNTGHIVSVTRKDDGVVTKWFNKLSNRNIKSIESFNKKLLVDCDATHIEETSRTFICSEEDGNVMDSCSWKDTTVVQGLYDSIWLRCNTMGMVESKHIFTENTFINRCQLKLKEGDYLTCGIVKKNRLYTMSLNGQLTIIDTDTFKVIWKQNTDFKLSTCINIYEKFGNNSSFIYIGNQIGEIFFIQLTDDNKISSTRKILNTVAITNIHMHPHGPVFSFADATIQGLKFLSFDSFLEMNLGNHNRKGEDIPYMYQNYFTLSKQGLFTVQNQKDIVLYNLNLI